MAVVATVAIAASLAIVLDDSETRERAEAPASAVGSQSAPEPRDAAEQSTLSEGSSEVVEAAEVAEADVSESVEEVAAVAVDDETDDAPPATAVIDEGAVEEAQVTPANDAGTPEQAADPSDEPFSIVVNPEPVISASVRQGDTALVQFLAGSGPSGSEIWVNFQGLRVPMVFAEPSGYVGYVPISPLTPPGRYVVSVEVVSEEGVRLFFDAGFEVVDDGAGIEEITLDPETAALLAPELVAIDNNTRFVEHTSVSGPRLWQGAWRLPVEGEVVGLFGVLRSYNGAPPNDWHHGHDIAADAGAPVVAPAGGVVVFAAELPVHGIGVIIDHGAGVYSGYWHMSELRTEVGARLDAGDAVGAIGTTGLSTGPHLHWEVIVHGRDVNPVQWLEASLSQ